jgi:hypothetical protein
MNSHKLNAHHLRLAAVKQTFGQSTVVEKQHVEELQEDVESAIMASIRYREKYIKAQANLKALKAASREELAETRRQVTEEMGVLAETKLKDLLTKMWTQSAVNAESSFVDRQHDLVDKQHHIEALAKICDHKAIALRSGHQDMQGAVAATLAEFRAHLNGMALEMSSASVDAEQKMMLMTEQVDEARRNVRDVGEVLARRDAELEAKQDEIVRKTSEIASLTREIEVYKKEKAKALQAAHTELNAVRRRSSAASAAADDTFSRTLREGISMLKHCRGKKKKHVKVIRWNGVSNSLTWDDGKKSFPLTRGFSLQYSEGERSFTFTDGEERLTLEIESSTGAKDFVGKIKPMLSKHFAEE